MLIFLLPLVVLTANFVYAALLAFIDQLNYFTAEDSEALEVCVVLEGMTEKNVNIHFSTHDNSANGNSIILWFLDNSVDIIFQLLLTTNP